MSEYIDKQELIETLEKRIKSANAYRMALANRDFIDLANDCTVVYDAVEVVRCKDCRYYQDNNGRYPHPDCKWGNGETPDEDDFCSVGERK